MISPHFSLFDTHSSRHRRISGFVFAVLSVALASLLAVMIRQLWAPANVSLIFVIAVLFTGARHGTWPALFAACIGLGAYGYLFIEPRLSFRVFYSEDLRMAAFFFVLALIAGQVAGRLRHRLEMLRAAQWCTERLLQFSRGLGQVGTQQAACLYGVEQMAAILGVRVCFYRSHAPAVYSSPERPAAALERQAMTLMEPPWVRQRTLGEWRALRLHQGEQTLGILMLQDSTLRHESTFTSMVEALAEVLGMTLMRIMLGEELAQAQLAEERERLRAALLSSVSHDLRTPLASITGASSALRELEYELSDADKRELVDGVISEAARLDRYIQNLLDMTRLGQGELKLTRDWVEPEDLVAAALTRLGKALSPYRVIHVPPDDQPLLNVNAGLIEQALVNVLDNAIKFSPHGGEIRILTRVSPQVLRWCIEDQGPGIPEAERAQVFDMFFTSARGDRGPHGSGLGLAICAGILEAHGGSISAHAASSGQGTCIMLTLPLTHPEQAHEGMS